MSRLKQLNALSSLLAGEIPVGVDWMAVLALANKSLVTPQVYAAQLRAGTAFLLPGDVRAFLEEVWRRNRVRNRRLFAQLREAVGALNEAGIEPTLLKGCAYWASVGQPVEYDRMLTDLDLMVRPQEAAAAIRALQAAGFVLYSRDHAPDGHVAAELGRPDDIGIIDLHVRPPGPEAHANAALGVWGQMLYVRWDGVRAKTPSPALQVFLMVLHDQFQDGGYWRGEFVLRHLMEIAGLSRQPGAIDWSVVDGLADTRLVRNAVDAQLLAARRLFGAVTPRRAGHPWARLQHARLLAQFRWPRLNPLLALLSG